MNAAEAAPLTPAPRFELRGTWIALLVPLLIAASQQWVLSWFFQSGYRASWQVAVCYALFVVQVGVAGAIAGRFIPGMLGWLVFAWTMLVIDLLTFCMAVSQRGGWHESGKVLACALVSAQVGAVVVWGVLGEQRWTVRVPVTVVIGAVMLLGWRILLVQLSYYNDWFSLLLMQTVLLLAICMVFLQRGCRLRQTTSATSASELITSKGVWQFNLKDAFILTTAIAIVMAVFKLTAGWQETHSRQFSILPFVSEIVLAATLAMVMFTALWTAFGERPWYVRFLVLISLAAGTAAIFGWCGENFRDWMVALEQWFRASSPRSWYEWEDYWFTRLGWFWLPWICLSCGFFVATLWIFREKGYRMVMLERRKTN